MKHLTLDQVVRIHSHQIERFGGTPGVKHLDLLESAVAQTQATFGGEALYRTLDEKAGALAFSLAQNHCFHDGNKRTAHAAMMMFLSRNGFTILATQNEQAEIIERVAVREPRLDRAGLVAWIRIRIVRK